MYFIRISNFNSKLHKPVTPQQKSSKNSTISNPKISKIFKRKKKLTNFNFFDDFQGIFEYQFEHEFFLGPFNLSSSYPREDKALIS